MEDKRIFAESESSRKREFILKSEFEGIAVAATLSHVPGICGLQRLVNSTSGVLFGTQEVLHEGNRNFGYKSKLPIQQRP